MSFRTRVLGTAVLSLTVLASVARAQEVTVRKKPARNPLANETVVYDDWSVSFSRLGSSTYELYSMHTSLASAQVAAEEIMQWNRGITNRDWMIGHILIEGSPSYRTAVSKSPTSLRTKTRSPVDRIFANTAVELDQILGNTRDVADYTVADIPDTGNVLNEFRKVVEMVSANATQLKKDMVKLQNKLTKDQLDQANRLIDQMVDFKADEFLSQKRVGAARLFMDEQAERSREVGARVHDLVSQLSRTSDPDEQQRLRDQLMELQKSGDLRESLLAENISQAARDEHQAAQSHVDAIRKLLSNSERQREEIVASTKAETVDTKSPERGDAELARRRAAKAQRNQRMKQLKEEIAKCRQAVELLKAFEIERQNELNSGRVKVFQSFPDAKAALDSGQLRPEQRFVIRTEINRLLGEVRSKTVEWKSKLGTAERELAILQSE